MTADWFRAWVRSGVGRRHVGRWPSCGVLVGPGQPTDSPVQPRAQAATVGILSWDGGEGAEMKGCGGRDRPSPAGEGGWGQDGAAWTSDVVPLFFHSLTNLHPWEYVVLESGLELRLVLVVWRWVLGKVT